MATLYALRQLNYSVFVVHDDSHLQLRKLRETRIQASRHAAAHANVVVSYVW